MARGLLTLIVLFSLHSYAKLNSEPHVVFLMHGFLGDDTTFGDLREILAHDYAGTKNVLFKELYYPTEPRDGNSKFIGNAISYQFSQMISSQIVSFFVENNLSSDTPISFIAHSQGGIVVLRYLSTCTVRPEYCTYYDGIANLEKAGWFDPSKRPEWLTRVDPHWKGRLKSRFSEKEKFDKPHNVRNIITLGTPFWGTPFANQYLHESSFSHIGSNLVGFPGSQLKDLSIGGEEISRLRWMLLNRGLNLIPQNEVAMPTDVFKSLITPQKIDQGIRYFNLAGISNDSLYSFFQSKDLENDMLISAPEARMDFLYYVEGKSPSEKTIQGLAVAESGFYPAQMAHLDLLPLLATPMAFVTWENFKTHPSYFLFRRILDNEFGFSETFDLTQKEKNKFFVDSLSNFTSEVKLMAPLGYQRPFAIRAGKLAAHDPKKFTTLKVGNSVLTDTSGQNKNGALIKNYFAQTYYHIGKFSRQYSFYPKQESIEDAVASRGPSKIDYDFSVLGFYRKRATLDVFPSLNSYAELMLQPILPLKSASTDVPFYAVDGQSALVLDSKLQVKRIQIQSGAGQCYVGLLGMASPDELAFNINRKNNFDAWDERALNKAYIFRNFDDPNRIGFNDFDLTAFALSAGYPMVHGHAFEVLGRFTMQINGKNVDRYLVTSPVIRSFDRSGMRFSDLGKSSGLGLRWVNVVDVDIMDHPEVARFEYKPSGKIVREIVHPYPRAMNDGCLKGDTSYVYPRPNYFQEKYYQMD